MHQALRALAAHILSRSDPAEIDPGRFRWDRLRREDTVRLRHDLAERYAPATANKLLSALRGVLRAARDLELLSEEEYQGAARLRQIRPVEDPATRTLETGELRALFTACAADHTAAGRRDAALLAIILITGARRAEAVSLDVGDYERSTGTLHIRSDLEGRDRRVKLPASARKAVNAWLDVRGDEPGPLLLPVDRGGIIRFRRLTDQAIYEILKRLAARAGVEHITARDLRRTFVVALIASDLDLQTVQKRVGHASWMTTAMYQSIAKRRDLSRSVPLEVPYVPPKQRRAKRHGT
ncbi:MAG: site-specific integrase [Planctomycetota bacterium]|nr:site-specific integrase [Planctomycetota bacterium]